MSDEARAKMSVAKKGVKKVFTDEHKANIKAAWLRRKQQEKENGQPTFENKRLP